ncbi:heterokaryon incompatibility het-6 [Fusarium pseudocircinatum]|uniref:Heterokaryon incompatibility het-6 n=1 Tax=Fusarium pseudocircinatum TaxID=56676 RepID=A0A8H5KZR3_9HYPO|nr:heterokaryon incompatibility het-6 [Fusarium pseudocircinatum]
MASCSTGAWPLPPLYQPLNKDKREIRLLEILPITPDNKVNCKLHTVLLTPDLYYTCISYVWGDPNITEDIVVDGVTRQVTVNLATALRHLKQHWIDIERMSDPELDTSKFRLWADALCINQKDDSERLHQVNMMADIYSSAAMVLAWITATGKVVQKAFKVFEKMVKIAEENVDSETWDSALPSKFTGLTEAELSKICESLPAWHISELSWLCPKVSTGFDTLDASKLWDGPYGAVTEFCALNFWNRVWIYQEVILAKRLYFVSRTRLIEHSSCLVALCGLVDFMELLRAGTVESRQKRNINMMQTVFSKIWDLSMARFMFRGIVDGDKNPAYCLWHLDLYFSTHSEASNKLDYIYGLLGVTKSPITPDYTKSIREVTLEFMAWVLPLWKAAVGRGRSNSRQILKFLNIHAIGLKRIDGLPSWAPVFSKADRRRPITRMREETCPAYCTVPELSNGLPIDIVGDSLWIKGVKAQTVMSVYDEYVSVHLMTTGLQKCIMEFMKSPQDIYPTGKTVLEVLCCTLLQKEKYEIFAFDVGLCIGHWTDLEIPAPSRNWTGQWSQHPYVQAVLLEWFYSSLKHEGNRLFTTKDGYIGTMPDDVLPGDVVCVLAGSEDLAVLRSEDDHYLFVGCCFMIGLMSGEVSELLASGSAKIETIEIR